MSWELYDSEESSEPQVRLWITGLVCSLAVVLGVILLG